MFVRTQRLTLRPGWPEDAPDLARAIGHEAVCRNLRRAPWPYGEDAAARFMAEFQDPLSPKFLVFEHVGGSVRLIGAAAIQRVGEQPHELGYWLTPSAWGRGYATEACAAVLAAARARGIRHVTSGHFVDNPASGKVLRKLGFRPSGPLVQLYAPARGGEAPCARYALDLEGDGGGQDADRQARMAA